MIKDRSWATRSLGRETFEALAERLPASELWTLLLEVFSRRASTRTPRNLIEQWEHDGFTRPAAVGARQLLAIDAQLFAAASGFEAIELSPLAPLGVCSVVAPTSQRRIVSALRGTEVVADPTNVLALECARRLRQDPAQTVRLATSHRAVRAQPAPKAPGFAQHFRLFCLATAGRERKDHGFVVEHLADHIATHLAALDRLEGDFYSFPDRRLTILATPERTGAADRLASAVRGPVVVRGTLEHAYYDGLRFTLTAGADDGSGFPLVDGGAFTWLGRLTSNQRLAFVASGFGTQMAAARFRVRSLEPTSPES